ncbi:hypothetical protein Taro_007350, partial [Colocasia esculenta]|nr:hypothetical protein [Colocasia esculenta]
LSPSSTRLGKELLRLFGAIRRFCGVLVTLSTWERCLEWGRRRAVAGLSVLHGGDGFRILRRRVSRVSRPCRVGRPRFCVSQARECARGFVPVQWYRRGLVVFLDTLTLGESCVEVELCSVGVVCQSCDLVGSPRFCVSQARECARGFVPVQWYRRGLVVFLDTLTLGESCCPAEGKTALRCAMMLAQLSLCLVSKDSLVVVCPSGGTIVFVFLWWYLVVVGTCTFVGVGFSCYLVYQSFLVLRWSCVLWGSYVRPVGVEEADPHVWEAGLHALEAGPLALEAGPLALEAVPLAFEAGPLALEAVPLAFEAGPLALEVVHLGPQGPLLMLALSSLDHQQF